jgi:O-antigen/teichoic acid export membrane protein
MKKVGGAFYLERLQRYLNLNVLLAYTVIATIVVLAPWVIGILFGSQYLEAVGILRVHAWATLFIFMSVARSQYLIVERYLKFDLLATASGAALNVILNFYLIPRYGGVGAAYATLISQAVSSYFSSLFLVRKSPIFAMQSASLIFPFRIFQNKDERHT